MVLWYVIYRLCYEYETAEQKHWQFDDKTSYISISYVGIDTFIINNAIIFAGSSYSEPADVEGSSTGEPPEDKDRERDTEEVNRESHFDSSV